MRPCRWRLAEAFLLCELMEHRHTSQANIQQLQSLSPLVSLSALERAFQCILRAERLVKPLAVNPTCAASGHYERRTITAKTQLSSGLERSDRIKAENSITLSQRPMPPQ